MHFSLYILLEVIIINTYSICSRDVTETAHLVHQ